MRPKRFVASCLRVWVMFDSIFCPEGTQKWNPSGHSSNAPSRHWRASSEFMKTVKQRFSVWFNRTHRRYGTLWADRFKSVLVEGSGKTTKSIVEDSYVALLYWWHYFGFGWICPWLYRCLAVGTRSQVTSKSKRNARHRLGLSSGDSGFATAGLWVIIVTDFFKTDQNRQINSIRFLQQCWIIENKVNL